MGWLFLFLVFVIIIIMLVDFFATQVSSWEMWAKTALDWEKLIERSQDHAKFRRETYITMMPAEWILGCEEQDRICEERWRAHANKNWSSIPKRMHPYYREIWEGNQC